jgi:beta-glucosidase
MLHRAIQEGVSVEAYYHWSLMDNFEWIEGSSPRYGLYAVDYATQTRTLRESGKLFSEIVRQNALPK